VEYEQLIVRANNLEPRNNSEYFIVDRQYAINRERIDLLGLYWARAGRRRKHQEVPLVLMEVKFALNTDIQDVHNQLTRYYAAIKPIYTELATEIEIIFRQKIKFGLLNQPPDRLVAMETLRVSRNIETLQFVLILVDYNPFSSQLDLSKLAGLPFSNKVNIFHSGFAMWRQIFGSLKAE
jgi:hypothetical protein